MGVKGLWSLLNPVARPVQIESLEGKRLAIDSSIWLYQFQSTMRDQDGRVLVNAHVLGFLRRINRLLFHGIKPVFVFDGGAPALKRSTITERKRRKLGAAQSHTKMAEKLLHAQMRRAAVMLAQEADERRAARIGARADGILEESEAIPENAVYLDELEGRPAARPVTTQISAASTSEPPKKKYKRDRYELPEADMPTYSTEERPDARLATEEELKHFIEEVGPTDIDVESPEFRALPTEVQYEIIGDLRVRSRQQSHARLTAMLKNAPTALDFSKAQIKHLSQRNALTQQLLTVTDSVGKAHLTIPVRVASERNREYVLVKRSQDDGGGWALGIRDGTKDKPIELEPETENDRRIRNAVERRTVRDEDSDSDSSVEEIKPTEVDKDLREHRRREVLEAITQRYAPKKQDDDPAPTRRKKNAVPLFDIDEDIMPTAHDEALALALQQEELGSEEDEPDANLARALALSRKKTPSSPPPLPPSSDDDEFEEVELIPSTHVSRANSVYEPIEISSDEEAPPLKNVPAPMVVDDSDDDLEPTEPPDPRRVAGSSFAPNTANGAPSVPRPSVVPLAVRDPEPAAPEPKGPHSTGRVGRPPPAAVEVHTVRRSPSPMRAAPSPSPPRGLSPHPQLRGAPSLSPPARGAPSPSLPPRAAPSPSPPAVAPAPSVSDLDEDELEEVSTEPSRATTPHSSGIATPSDLEETQRNSLPQLSRLRYEVHEDSDEEDDAIEWSRSPSPVLRKDGMGKPLSALASTLGETQPDEASGLTSGHVSDYASEAEMDAEDMVAEEDEYARFLAQIQNRDLAEVRTEIDDEIRILNQQTKAAMRDSDEITQSMVVQIQTLLRHFGIPYITAPMEAEAQCAKLAELGLVEGIITDDSDVFLFGGSTCFKNIFNDAKYAECYAATDIERELSLPRHRLIELAYLLGSDYTIGILGVGPVMALELLANFPGNSSLQRFKEWWATVQVGKDDVTTETKWMRSFKKRFAGTLELGGDWPNPLVRDAYNHPQTDESDEPFCWGFPRLAALRTFLHEELSWSISKVDDELTPIVQRIAARGRGAVPRQGTLLPFFDHSAAAGSLVPRRRTTANISKRLLSVIKEFREAEARAAGQDPHGWGEMLAGVDESDPRGTKDGQKEVKKGRSKGEKQEAEVGKDGNKPKTRKAPAKRVKKSNGKEKKDQEGENEATGDGTAEWTVTTRKAPTRRAKRASKSMAEDSEEEAPAPTKRRKKASKAEED
ncbi:hypothetical protein CcaverHIS631_0701130 [Cutaneotrichosporon cavernicola]|nr:hypothetical protein CcaverHIS631_0701130 [Cutaneotrichosporon cavernicola]BEJ10077.1 hypothetical protein CcaverHIS641_0701120 [Cutaneotrichosporon cavernicola]